MGDKTQNPIDEIIKSLGLDEIKKSLEDINKERALEAEKARRAQEEEAFQAKVKALVDSQVGEQKAQLLQALELVKTLQQTSTKSAEEFAKTLEERQEEVLALKEQVKQLNALRSGRGTVDVNPVTKALMGTQKDFEKEAEDLVLLSRIVKKGVFETEHGKAHLEKYKDIVVSGTGVNESSSLVVSSEAYETLFNTSILRDIQKELVVASLFTELPMTQANLTMPIESGPAQAKWVDANTYGKPETTGEWAKTELTEINFRTYKLSAKAFVTDETTEDAIIVVLPIIRRRLVEAHAYTIEQTFMTGSGTNMPEGLLTMAKADSHVISTEASADGTVQVTAKMLHKLRRTLGRKGIKLNKLVLVISMDAYYDLLEDDEFQDVSQVEAANAVKLTGQVGRVYGMPVVVSEFFPNKEAGAAYAFIAYRDDFVVPRQRSVTIEEERVAESQRYNIYVTQRLNLQRFFKGDNIVAAAYKA